MQAYLEQVQSGISLSVAQSQEAFTQLLSGHSSPQMAEAFLLALKSKGEAEDEITGAALAMRAAMLPFEAPEGAIDVCGTGGDGAHTYNISTTVAIVVAACGVPVVKHGNRAVSSRSGSSDVLSALGVGLTDNHSTLQHCLEQAGICYLAAPFFHPQLKHVAPIRAKLKTRTIFNLLGPLCNPAQVRLQLMGVYDEALTRPIATVLSHLGSSAAAVVHGVTDHLDELSISGASRVAQLLEGDIFCYEMTPELADLPTHSPSAIRGGNAQENAEALKALLDGTPSAYQDAVLLNSAAALIVADKADDPQTGVALAREAIASGRAKQVLQQLIAYSQ